MEPSGLRSRHQAASSPDLPVCTLTLIAANISQKALPTVTSDWTMLNGHIEHIVSILRKRCSWLEKFWLVEIL